MATVFSWTRALIKLIFCILITDYTILHPTQTFPEEIFHQPIKATIIPNAIIAD